MWDERKVGHRKLGHSVRYLCGIKECLQSEIILYGKKVEKKQVKPKVSKRRKIMNREETIN